MTCHTSKNVHYLLLKVGMRINLKGTLQRSIFALMYLSQLLPHNWTFEHVSEAHTSRFNLNNLIVIIIQTLLIT